MYNIVALMGKAGTGKDTVMRELIKIYPNFKEMISCTTRPPRESEVDGVNYHFITDMEFLDRVASGDMFEYTKFNNWLYGSAISNLHENCWHIGVFNPDGVRQLQKLHNVNVYIICLEVSDKERLLRQLNREEFPDVNEIIRRYQADIEDFSFDNLKDFEALWVNNQGNSPNIMALKIWDEWLSDIVATTN